MYANEPVPELDDQAWQEQLKADPEFEKWLNTTEEERNMDMKKYSQSDSKDLKAIDFIGKNLKVTIIKVEIRDYPAKEGQPANSRPVLSFQGKEKQLVLNATNTKTLCDAYGYDSNNWLNHEIGLTVADYTDKGFGHGWVVTPLDVSPPDFNDDIPF